MTKVQRAIDVCDFCYSYHQYYMPWQLFNYWKKEGVANCSLCSEHNVMCMDCYNNSMQELNGSVLLLFKMAICRNCVVQIWRLTDAQERLEALAKKHIESVQEKMRKDAYILTQNLQCQP